MNCLHSRRRRRAIWLAVCATGLVSARPAIQDSADGGHESSHTDRQQEFVPASAATASYLTTPLYLGEEPPPLRSLARIQIRFVPGEGASLGRSAHGSAPRDRGAARALADGLLEELSNGADFGALAVRHTEDNRRNLRGVLGSFAPGMLRPELERFLWSAAVGDVSEPFETEDGFEILQRVETYAGCRTLYLAGRGEAERGAAAKLLERARSGEAFALLQEAHGREGSPRAIVFERGRTDQLLKRAIFEAHVGETVGPFDAPGGLVLGQRVPPEELAGDVWPQSFVRARALFIAHRDVGGSRELSERSFEQARTFAEETHAKLVLGADMAQLARQHDDDRGGRERAGDLGWLYRENQAMASVLAPLFRARPGELLELLPLEAGWLCLRRER